MGILKSNKDKEGAKSALTGAGKGAMAGAMFGPVGMGLGALIGGIGGWFGGSGRGSQMDDLEAQRAAIAATPGYNLGRGYFQSNYGGPNPALLQTLAGGGAGNDPSMYGGFGSVYGFKPKPFKARPIRVPPGLSKPQQEAYKAAEVLKQQRQYAMQMNAQREAAARNDILAQRRDMLNQMATAGKSQYQQAEDAGYRNLQSGMNDLAKRGLQNTTLGLNNSRGVTADLLRQKQGIYDTLLGRTQQMDADLRNQYRDSLTAPTEAPTSMQSIMSAQMSPWQIGMQQDQARGEQMGALQQASANQMNSDMNFGLGALMDYGKTKMLAGNQQAPDLSGRSTYDSRAGYSNANKYQPFTYG